MASSGRSSGGSSTKDYSEGKPKKKTPESWKSKKSQHHKQNSGKYPNYHSFKTRSGHSVVYDDSKGEESVTIQHRGGSAIQFLPDGAVQITAHNGMYNIVFGEQRMTVTGAHDLTVKGHGSMLVYGDYNKTVHGDVNMTVTGDYNVNCKKSNLVAREGAHTVADEVVTKVANGMQYQVGGDFAVAAKNQVGIVAKGQFSAGGKQTSLHAGSSGLDITSHGNANVTVKKKMVTDVQGDHSVNVQGDNKHEFNGDSTYKVGGDFHQKVSGNFNQDASKKYFNSGQAQPKQLDSQFSLQFNESGNTPSVSNLPSDTGGLQ